MKEYSLSEQEIAESRWLSHDQVAKQTGRSYPSVVRYRKKHKIEVPDERGRRWGAKEDDELQALYLGDMRRKEIASILSRSEASIAARLAILKKQGRI
jgi:DNA-binding CsgD family transcriptional regulator